MQQSSSDNYTGNLIELSSNMLRVEHVNSIAMLQFTKDIYQKLNIPTNRWKLVDENGRTILHTALCAAEYDTIMWLFKYRKELGFDDEFWKKSVDNKGKSIVADISYIIDRIDGDLLFFLHKLFPDHELLSKKFNELIKRAEEVQDTIIGEEIFDRNNANNLDIVELVNSYDSGDRAAARSKKEHKSWRGFLKSDKELYNMKSYSSKQSSSSSSMQAEIDNPKKRATSHKEREKIKKQATDTSARNFRK